MMMRYKPYNELCVLTLVMDDSPWFSQLPIVYLFYPRMHINLVKL